MALISLLQWRGTASVPCRVVPCWVQCKRGITKKLPDIQHNAPIYVCIPNLVLQLHNKVNLECNTLFTRTILNRLLIGSQESDYKSITINRFLAAFTRTRLNRFNASCEGGVLGGVLTLDRAIMGNRKVLWLSYSRLRWRNWCSRIKRIEQLRHKQTRLTVRVTNAIYGTICRRMIRSERLQAICWSKERRSDWWERLALPFSRSKHCSAASYSRSSEPTLN